MITFFTYLLAQSSGATKYVQKAAESETDNHTMTIAMIISGLIVGLFMFFLKRSIDTLDGHITDHGKRISDTEKDMIAMKVKLDDSIVQIKKDISELKANATRQAEKQDERWLEVIKYMHQKPSEDKNHDSPRH